MNIEDELNEISSKIYSEESQLRLQHILTEKIQTCEISSYKAHELLYNISTNLTKSLLESKLYHMINSVKTKAEIERENSIGKSILDLNGDFI